MPAPDDLLAQPQPGIDAARAGGWTWPEARQACDDHARGTFESSWQFAVDAPTLPAVRAALLQRFAVPGGLPWSVEGPERAPGRIELEGARTTWATMLRRLLRSTLYDVALMGLSVWQHPIATNPDTLRAEYITVERFPLSSVRYTRVPFPDAWNPGRYIQEYYAVVFGYGSTMAEALYGPTEPSMIDLRTRGVNLPFVGPNTRFVQLPRPGTTDGHWTVVAEGDRPHEFGAIRALDVAYVAGQLSARSLANLLRTLGRQVPIGVLPGTTPLKSPEGDAMIKVLSKVGIEADGAVLPGGADIKGFSLANPTASLFIDDAQLNMLRVSLAILGRATALGKSDAQYESKGSIDREIPEDLVRDDVGLIERAGSALFNHVANVNGQGGSPIRLCGHLPDSDRDRRVKDYGARRAAYLADLAAERLMGIPPEQDHADELAKVYEVLPVVVPPALPLATASPPTPSIPQGSSATP